MCQSRGYPITGVQLQKVVKPVIGHPRDIVCLQVCEEPITIENFVIDTITSIICNGMKL